MEDLTSCSLLEMRIGQKLEHYCVNILHFSSLSCFCNEHAWICSCYVPPIYNHISWTYFVLSMLRRKYHALLGLNSTVICQKTGKIQFSTLVKVINSPFMCIPSYGHVFWFKDINYGCNTYNLSYLSKLVGCGLFQTFLKECAVSNDRLI